ncbi:MAG: GAF domain-containing protein [Ktedonobacteraceae bacterium]
MEKQHEFSTWRDLLGHTTKNPQERARLAREIDVQPITLRRWVSGESQPRDENIRRLARALATDLSALFLRLIEVDFPTFVREKVEPGPFVPEIPAELYAQMFQIYTKTPASIVNQRLQSVLLERAIEHLDPHKLGLCLTFAACVPPVPGQKVRCLRQIDGIGTPPWERDLERKTIFLGIESLAGNAIMHERLIYVESRDAVAPCPIQWTNGENSAVAIPILRQGKIAGVLLASSAQAAYFTSAHRSLLERYAQLAGLLFPPAEFYKLKDIQLAEMPDYEIQKPHFIHFEQRVRYKQGEATASGEYLSIQQVHQSVWGEIAEELLLLVVGDGS